MRARRPKVLIVDDEDEIALLLHRTLYQDNDRYDVLLARSAEIAQQILEACRVDVLVTDVQLPEKSGMDLLSWVAVQAPSTRVIVMTGESVGAIKDRAHAFGCLRLMRKPLDLEEMRGAILGALTLRDTFHGSLSELSCVDVIQMLCIARKSTALRLSEEGSAGVIHIEEGAPIHAVWDDLSGEEAFYRILGVKRGVFCTAPLPTDLTRSLHGDWQHLMIEGLRRLDEANAGRVEEPPDPGDRPSFRISFGSFPPPHPSSIPPPIFPESTTRSTDAAREHANGSTVTLSRAEVSSALEDAPTPQPAVTRLVDEGFSALRAGRRDEARRLWEEALRLDPENRTLELNLRKLGGGTASRPGSSPDHSSRRPLESGTTDRLGPASTGVSSVRSVPTPATGTRS